MSSVVCSLCSTTQRKTDTLLSRATGNRYCTNFYQCKGRKDRGDAGYALALAYALEEQFISSQTQYLNEL